MNKKDSNKEVITPLTVDEDGNCEIIGVRFKNAGKVYYFSPEGLSVTEEDCVIVETARGLEYGFVAEGNRKVSSDEIVQPLRCVIRIATEADSEQYERNKQTQGGAARP